MENQKKTITWILPRTGEEPIGGFKVVYEYANRFAKNGYNINIVYGICSRPIKNNFIKICYYFCRYFRYIKYKYFYHYKPTKWFICDERINHKLCYKLTDSYIPNTDIIFATSWSTAYWVDKYSKTKNINKFYLIQSFEDWDTAYDTVIETWKMDLNKIVIAPWLENIAISLNEKCILIENGFDINKFHITIPIKNKNKYSIVMLWHNHPLKSCNIGLAAINKVKEKYPQLTVNLFGVPSRPNDLPSWINYYQTPSPEEHLYIYNSSAIFIGPSSVEGFCLTPPEAMLCGCAVVCSNIGGYTVVAKHNETALLSNVGDINSFTSNIIKLIENDELRYRLAEAGNQLIQQYTWDKAYDKMKHTIAKSFHK